MTSKEALENIKDAVEYITRLDYVDPIVRGEVKQILFDAYHKTTPEFEIIEKDLELLEKLLDLILGIEYTFNLKQFDGKGTTGTHVRDFFINNDSTGRLEERLRLKENKYDK